VRPSPLRVKVHISKRERKRRPQSYSPAPHTAIILVGFLASDKVLRTVHWEVLLIGKLLDMV
jgi:hypothetical protein